MKQLLKKVRDKLFGDPNLDCGVFSKREAARFLAEGRLHVHSAMLGLRDAYVQKTKTYLENPTEIPQYPWEDHESPQEIELASSKERRKLIDDIVNEPQIKSKRFLRERVGTVLEEMITNAIYHPYYHEDDNTSKYSRMEEATLDPREAIKVKYKIVDDGVYLSVEDRGGSLEIDNITSCFHRCYQEKEDQIEKKEGGAGLGLYMIFEMVSHLKIHVTRGKHTKVSCWIPDRKRFDPDSFSVNLFFKEK